MYTYMYMYIYIYIYIYMAVSRLLPYLKGDPPSGRGNCLGLFVKFREGPTRALGLA